MTAARVSQSDERLIEKLLRVYEGKRKLISNFRDSIVGAINSSDHLAASIHSIKTRLKDPEHLRHKLRRKILRSKTEGSNFDIDENSLLTRITDLAGVRILHLYTRQIKDIDAGIRDILEEQPFELLEGPFARTWDDESRDFFEICSIETQKSPTLYTSVHYVVGSKSRTRITCEIQVRTLMEEVWGEVDHTINYPNPASSLACREQLKALARITSGATRLVDSIFLTFHDDVSSAASRSRRQPPTLTNSRGRRKKSR